MRLLRTLRLPPKSLMFKRWYASFWPVSKPTAHCSRLSLSQRLRLTTLRSQTKNSELSSMNWPLIALITRTSHRHPLLTTIATLSWWIMSFRQLLRSTLVSRRDLRASISWTIRFATGLKEFTRSSALLLTTKLSKDHQMISWLCSTPCILLWKLNWQILLPTVPKMKVASSMTKFSTTLQMRTSSTRTSVFAPFLVSLMRQGMVVNLMSHVEWVTRRKTVKIDSIRMLNSRSTMIESILRLPSRKN